MGRTVSDLRDVSVRKFVQACANDPDIINRFNEAHGLELKCPIEPLVNPSFSFDISEDELRPVACFVAWVQHSYWHRLRAERNRTAKLRASISRRWAT